MENVNQETKSTEKKQFVKQAWIKPEIEVISKASIQSGPFISQPENATYRIS